MSTGARAFFVGSIVVTGLIFYGVNSYSEQEKQRKRANIFAEIERRDEKHRSNMEQYQRQLQLEQRLKQEEKVE